MNLYLACSGMMFHTYRDDLFPRFCVPEPRFAELRSYFENNIRTFNGHTLPKFGNPFFIDSGAFSAYMQKIPISFEEYSSFLLAYGDQADLYCGLDAIPEGPTKEAKKKSAEETWQNQLKMEAMGLKPVPVFHSGEPWQYLERYIDRNEYICIGGLVNTPDVVDGFLHTCWSKYLTDSKGDPIRKVHGFGMTTLKHLVAYPWASVDSSTWLVHSKYGIISVPPKKPDGAGFDYRKKPILLSVSDESSFKTEEGKHIDNLTPIQKDAVAEFVEQFGLTMWDLRREPVPRMIINFEYWLNVEKACSDYLRKPEQYEIF